MSLNNPFTDENEPQHNLGAGFLHLNNVPNHGILLCDPRGHIVDANRNFCDLLALSLDEIRGKHICSDTCLEMGLEQISICFENFLTERTNNCISNSILKDGIELFFEISISVVSNEYIGIFIKNITEEHKLRAKLQDVTTELRELYEHNNQFLSILARDLKSPFNTIMGFVKLLKENFKVYSPDKIERYISNIENSSQNTYNLLEGTLAWAGAKSGKLILSKNEHALNDIVAKLVRELNVIAVLKNINIHFSEISEINVFCDARIITIILRNLLSNAIKFTDYGGEINIYFEENDLEVLVSVTDNGNGIAPDFLPKLFKMTSINNAEGAGNEKGTGIGLIICKELIEKHEGKIWATSELGIGSNFKFTIPKQLGVNT